MSECRYLTTWQLAFLPDPPEPRSQDHIPSIFTHLQLIQFMVYPDTPPLLIVLATTSQPSRLIAENITQR